MTSRTLRIVAVAGAAALLLGAFVAGPAEARKKKKHHKPVAACAPYAPSGGAEGAEVVSVTDAATADAPVEVTVTTEPGLGSGRPADQTGGAVSEAFVPVQVDSAAASAGLYARVDFTPVWDYDLYMTDDTGTDVGASGGSLVIDDSELGGDADHSETGAGFEAIYGVTSTDCQGFNVDVVGATTPGEDVTLTLWLGEAIP
jgi:hypothetical protein